MKLYIYIILFILLVVYINCHTKYISEKFTEHFNAINPYTILNTNQVKPVLIDSHSGMVPAFDSNDSADLFSSKYWVIKKQGFSDIYNYEDAGSAQIFNLVNDSDNEIKPEIKSEVKSEVKVEVKSEVKSEVKGEVKEKVKSEIKKLPNEIKYNNLTYKLLGIAANEYFNQYYYLYEYETKIKIDNIEPREELKYINNKVYEYLLVKIHNDKPEVVHYVGPRNKIQVNDIVYFSMGIFQLGPLVIKKIN